MNNWKDAIYLLINGALCGVIISFSGRTILDWEFYPIGVAIMGLIVNSMIYGSRR